MKLAVIGDEISQDHAVVTRTAARLGFDGVEIRSVAQCPPHLLDDDALAGIRRTLLNAGLAVAGFAPPVFKQDLPGTDRELAAAERVLLRAVEQAGLLGAPHVRIFSFYRDGDPDPAAAAAVAGELLAAVPPEVRLLVETGTRTNTPTIAHTMDFLDRLGRAGTGVLWDPGNIVFSGWGGDPARDYERARALIGHVHVKDPDGTRRYVRLGDGDVDWPAILSRLAEDGYAGYLSLETHWRRSKELTPHERDHPWGEAFSAGGFPASVECMEVLRSWRDGLGSVRDAG
ncbi:sugar phosphate isomerase/epimerase [Nonomuraea sp. NPDC049421]|uniref:sugar phosphate isomerase/epimerase family protein n=1 Tax=Nonomuraea sp. NPDC049421 TaxID=3155275 RepID=UPI00342D96E1